MKNSQERKATPVFSGVIQYFPRALREVAKCSAAGNKQHNEDDDLYWDRDKSTDELDALTRHLLDAGKIDTDGVRHSAKIAWRALANLEKEMEEVLCIGDWPYRPEYVEVEPEHACADPISYSLDTELQAEAPPGSWEECDARRYGENHNNRVQMEACPFVNKHAASMFEEGMIDAVGDGFPPVLYELSEDKMLDLYNVVEIHVMDDCTTLAFVEWNLDEKHHEAALLKFPAVAVVDSAIAREQAHRLRYRRLPKTIPSGD